MDTPQPTEEKLFAEALARPAAERPAFLDGACRGNAALRARLEALLAAHEQSDGLNPPAGESLRSTLEMDPPAPSIEDRRERPSIATNCSSGLAKGVAGSCTWLSNKSRFGAGSR
jgi:hypothetical protein